MPATVSLSARPAARTSSRRDHRLPAVIGARLLPVIDPRLLHDMISIMEIMM